MTARECKHALLHPTLIGSRSGTRAQEEAITWRGTRSSDRKPFPDPFGAQMSTLPASARYGIAVAWVGGGRLAPSLMRGAETGAGTRGCQSMTGWRCRALHTCETSHSVIALLPTQSSCKPLPTNAEGIDLHSDGEALPRKAQQHSSPGG